jgi:hypothetical protein
MEIAGSGILNADAADDADQADKISSINIKKYPLHPFTRLTRIRCIRVKLPNPSSIYAFYHPSDHTKHSMEDTR